MRGGTTGGLGDGEVPDSWQTSDPGSAEDCLGAAVEVAETRWVRDGRQEGYRFLAAYELASSLVHQRALTFHFRFAGSQPPKQLSFLPVTMIIHSVGPSGLGDSFLW